MTDKQTIARLRAVLAYVMLDLDRQDASTFVREIIPAVRSTISKVLQETAPIKTPLGERQRTIAEERRDVLKLQSGGAGHRHRLVREQLRLRSEVSR